MSRAFCRSLKATMQPIRSGAPDRAMYWRMIGEKYPPAPALTDTENGCGSDNAHVALDSDCFSNPRVRTRRWMRAWTSDAATSAVDPPTEPAVWTLNMGLPTHPRASAR